MPQLPTLPRNAIAGLALASLIAACSGGSPSPSAPPAQTSGATAAPATPSAPPAYPTKAVTIIVPFNAGGPADLAARLVAEYAAKEWGVPVQVVNVAGASGVTGALQALQAPADGYTMLLDSSATASVISALRTDLPFKLEDRVYAGRVSTDYYYFVASTTTPWKTLDEAMAAAKADPAKFTWGAAAAGSSVQLLGAQVLSAYDVPVNQTKMVIFEGGNAPNVQALAGGNVQFIPTVKADAQTLADTGKGRILAASAPTRTTELPDVPATGELGKPQVTLGTWQAIAGRSDLPDYIVGAWEALLLKASTDPDFLSKAAEIKRQIAFVPGDEWRTAVLAERDALIPLAEATGIRQ